MVATHQPKAPSYISQVETALSRSGVGQLASLCGRYWAMDRDQRWERTEKAYKLYTDPEIAIDSRTAEQVLARVMPIKSPMSSSNRCGCKQCHQGRRQCSRFQLPARSCPPDRSSTLPPRL